MKARAVILMLAAACMSMAIACRSEQAPDLRTHALQSAPQPPIVVVPVDNATGLSGNVMGVPGNPIVATLSSTTGDGGTASPGPVDTTTGDQLNTLVVNNTAGVQGILVDAGTRAVVDVNVTNEGTVNGWWQLYCGQYVLDAGGTAGALTVPNLQLRCPGGTQCGQQLRAPLSCAGAAWYSSAAPGTLTTASAPNMTLTAAAIR